MVRARRGERHAYQPIVSQLCKTCDPVEVAKALFRLYPFASLYIADLDAIQQREKHLSEVAAIRRALPAVEIWIDAGVASIEDCQPWLDIGVRCVVGSESQHTADSTAWLIDLLGREQAVLSLDHSTAGQAGPKALFEDTDHWPARIIGMTLGKVGSYEGPDWATLQQLRHRVPDKKIYAAGGIRNFADIERLTAMGIAGALLASALHDGKITSEELAKLGK